MSTTPTSRLVDLISRHEEGLLQDWLQEQRTGAGSGGGLSSDEEIQRESREFLALLRAALSDGGAESVDGAAWGSVRDYLSALSRSRARAGFSPSETAMFVLSLKQPLFARLAQEFADDLEALPEAMWNVNVLLDRLALLTTEEHQRGREAVIQQQQRDLIELSTPVVKLWEGVLAVPLIGTLDSERTQVVMESLLERIVETNSTMAIIDITGVPTVDTLVAQHLLKTVAAARLMGAECIISGIRPQIAQTIVHLGIDLQGIATKASLADALSLAMQQQGFVVTRSR